MITAAGLLAAAACDSAPHYRPDEIPTNSAGGHTYYVSADGDDDDDGGSRGRAWRTLERADQVIFRPGDRLLLEGGESFAGSLRLGPEEAGDPARPVQIGSYGEGRARIDAAGVDAITVYNTGGVEVSDLVVAGDAAAYGANSGIAFFSDAEEGRRYAHAVVRDVDVAGFRTGVSIGGTRGTGFSKVRVANSMLHDNRDSGLLTFGVSEADGQAPRYSHENVLVERVAAYRNAGNPENLERHAGNGIVIGSVRGGTVQYSSAYDNGANSATKSRYGGPIGIWSLDATGVTIQHCVSYRNRSRSRVDGGGFGLDLSTTASTLQYNLSFDNDGPGYLVYGGTYASGAQRGGDPVTVRYNVSSDDGRMGRGGAGIEVYSPTVKNVQVYQNTVSISTTDQGSPAAVLLRILHNPTAFRNNVFITDGVAPLVETAEPYPASHLTFQQNVWFAGAGAWSVRWGQQVYNSLDAWRAATGAETLGGRATGLQVDPCLAGGTRPDIQDPEQVGLVVPVCGTIVGKGLDLIAEFGIDPGPVDYYGKPVTVPPTPGAASPAPGVTATTPPKR